MTMRRAIWVVLCAACGAGAGAWFGLQYNLAGAAILGSLGLAFGAGIGFSNRCQLIDGVLQFLN
ncbi:hypothetical protein [Devosia lucknowensis]|uniref:hypothetical protein n=1 Tax=Devosia lucknowensis TaxID=1096929 RepID=UPI000A3B6B1F|nr:hypothetical protein [Devosia lucknowensis]